MDDATRNLGPVHKRRWFQFSIRTMFVLVTVLTVLGYWLGYQLNWIHERHNARVGTGIGKAAIRQPDGSTKWIVLTPDAPWPLGWFGEKGVKFLMLPKSTPREEVDRILALFPEADREIEFVADEEIDPAFWEADPATWR